MRENTRVYLAPSMETWREIFTACKRVRPLRYLNAATLGQRKHFGSVNHSHRPAQSTSYAQGAISTLRMSKRWIGEISTVSIIAEHSQPHMHTQHSEAIEQNTNKTTFKILPWCFLRSERRGQTRITTNWAETLCNGQKKSNMWAVLLCVEIRSSNAQMS